MAACGRCLMGGSSSAGFCCAYASPSTRHGAPLRTEVDARDISSGPQARAQGQAQAVQAVQAEQNGKASRLAGVNATEREPGEGWRVLETAVVRAQAAGASCCTGESTRLATDWTARKTRTERMAEKSQLLRPRSLEIRFPKLRYMLRPFTSEARWGSQGASIFLA